MAVNELASWLGAIIGVLLAVAAYILYRMRYDRF